MKAIITVVGKDKSGIVAGVSGKNCRIGFEHRRYFSNCFG